MAKRKKREARNSTEAHTSPSATKRGEGEAARQLPPAKPPRRNPPMLAISLLLFSGWFAFLLYVAFAGNL